MFDTRTCPSCEATLFFAPDDLPMRCNRCGARLFRGQLNVTIIKAKNLDVKDLFTSDPYCRLVYRDHFQSTSEDLDVVPKELNPVWDVSRQIPNVTDGGKLGVFVIDKNRWMADAPMGHVMIDLKDLPSNETVTDWYTLSKTERGGRIKLTLHLRDDKQALWEGRDFKELIGRCHDQQHDLVRLHHDIQGQIQRLADSARALKAKQGREEILIKYRDEIRDLQAHAQKIREIFVTVWRKGTYLSFRYELVMLRRRVPPPLCLPGIEMARKEVDDLLAELSHLIATFHKIALEADLSAQTIAAAPIDADSRPAWVDDAACHEVIKDRDEVHAALLELSQRMAEQAARHDLARDHLEFEFHRLRRPNIDLAFLSDDLPEMVDLTAPSATHHDAALIQDLAMSLGSLQAIDDASSDLDRVRIDLEASMQAVAEIESLCKN